MTITWHGSLRQNVARRRHDLLLLYDPVCVEVLDDCLAVLVDQVHDLAAQLLLPLRKLGVDRSLEDAQEHKLELLPATAERVVGLHEEQRVDGQQQWH